MKVFITVFNRFTWMLPLLEDFKKAGLEPILIDNHSTYPPLLEWYKHCEYPVHFLPKNHLAWAFFTTELYKLYDNERYFIISDSDMDISKVPLDWPQVLFEALQRADDPIWKAALGYEIGDLPQNEMTDMAIRANWAQNSNPDSFGFTECATDLGIAMYDRLRRSPTPNKEENWYASVRAPKPYYCRHLDWYMTSETLREEDIYYLKEARYYSYLCLMNSGSQNPIANLHQYKTEV